MKTLIAIVAMVLLSTAAWGCDWCNNPEYQAQKLGITKQEANQRLWDKYKSLPIKGTIPDPTSWKQTDSKNGTEENQTCKSLCFSRCKDGVWNQGVETANYNCYNDCMLACEKDRPWVDSRYRLERNEVTGECRIQFRSDKYGWMPVNYWPGGLIYEKVPSCDELKKHLDQFRSKEPEDRRREQINKAWKPIK